MHTCNSSRSYVIITVFSARHSAVLFPSFLVSSCSTASFLRRNVATHLPSAPGSFLRERRFPSPLFHSHILVSRFSCPGPSTAAALGHGEDRQTPHHLQKGHDQPGCADGTWLLESGRSTHTSHTAAAAEKLTASCHKSDHLETGFQMHKHGYVYKGTITGTTFHDTNTLCCPCSQMGWVKNTHVSTREKWIKSYRGFSFQSIQLCLLPTTIPSSLLPSCHPHIKNKTFSVENYKKIKLWRN